jgi:hypothetical protein
MNDANVVNILTTNEEKLRYMFDWLWFLIHERIKDSLGNRLCTVKKRLVYNFTNGINRRYRIDSLLDISDDIVQEWPNACIFKSILRKTKRVKNLIKLFSLEEFNIRIKHIGPSKGNEDEKEIIQ